MHSLGKASARIKNSWQRLLLASGWIMQWGPGSQNPSPATAAHNPGAHLGCLGPYGFITHTLSMLPILWASPPVKSYPAVFFKKLGRRWLVSPAAEYIMWWWPRTQDRCLYHIHQGSKVIAAVTAWTIPTSPHQAAAVISVVTWSATLLHHPGLNTSTTTIWGKTTSLSWKHKPRPNKGADSESPQTPLPHTSILAKFMSDLVSQQIAGMPPSCQF